MRRRLLAVLGVVVVVVAAVAGYMSAAQDWAPGELLYATGFENGARIVSSNPGKPAANDDMIDGEGSRRGSGIGGLRFYYEGGDPSMRFARIVAENGNPSNRVVHFWANQANAKNFSKTRIQATVRSVPAGLREFYQTVRLYLPEDMALLRDYPSEITWLTIMEVWNNAPLKPFPFRVTVGLHKPVKGTGDIFFHAKAQDIDQTDVMKPIFTTLWANTNTQFSVPFGKWMTLDYYLAEGDRQTGRFHMAVTPEGGSRLVLFDITNATHHTLDPAPDGFSHWNPIKLYTSRQLVDYMRAEGKALEAYWDDISIWKGHRPWPPGKFDSGGH